MTEISVAAHKGQTYTVTTWAALDAPYRPDPPTEGEIEDILPHTDARHQIGTIQGELTDLFHYVHARGTIYRAPGGERTYLLATAKNPCTLFGHPRQRGGGLIVFETEADLINFCHAVDPHGAAIRLTDEALHRKAYPPTPGHDQQGAYHWNR